MKFKFIVIIMLFSILQTACTGSSPVELGIHDGRLQACPDTPNCVQSYIQDAKSYIEPFPLLQDNEDLEMEYILRAVLDSPRTEIIKRQSNYIRAEFKSLIMRFVDDVEFYLDENESVIHVRSASRIGHSDFGVNRKRIEKIRQRFMQRDTDTAE